PLSKAAKKKPRPQGQGFRWLVLEPSVTRLVRAQRLNSLIEESRRAPSLSSRTPSYYRRRTTAGEKSLTSDVSDLAFAPSIIHGTVGAGLYGPPHPLSEECSSI